MPFQTRGLAPEDFLPLFDLPDQALRERGIHRVRADEPDAYPCRVSLRRATVGECLLLLHHIHQPNPLSPYRAGGPIFVGQAEQAGHYQGELPPILRDRVLSLRAYDADALIVDAAVAEARLVEETIEQFLARPEVCHVDAHFAGRGCFGARIERA
ncbi:DUF1203 domain-containing protein [Microvirga pudoricolor]|uniref:DUF1203 domain-containing protein n=1 Tax=Microvirga pudoricolor TaxID=2778729 RepID=UPI0019503850|nr:DUF1203 domain-containing protein [Microvirga pudoricolor]MBM6595961.1 DUF1203 domain-containing protein [Microvirga pudoricolor]